MKKIERFEKAAKLKVEFESQSERKIYLKVGKYNVTIGFEPRLNEKKTVEYSRLTFDCTCTHAAMRTCLPGQSQNLCSCVLAAIAWMVNNQGKLEGELQ